MGDVQPNIGDRVTYFDSDEDEHRAVVVDDVEGEDYISVVRADPTTHEHELGEGYVYKTTTETSVLPREEYDEPHTFKPRWSE